MKEDIQNLVIIGSGVMGLSTAYAAAPFTRKITLLEKSRIGNKRTASFGYIANCAVRFPLSPDRPSQCKYYIPPVEKQELFTAGALPVFAYLDVGIYGHPIYAGKTPGVKIGFYNPPDVNVVNTHIHDVASFVETCMPSLRDAEAIDVTEVDQCFYDLVGDDNFILGPLPAFPDIAVGVGWRGTGYKYAPWVGQTLMQLTLQGGTVYDIGRFDPQRFA